MTWGESKRGKGLRLAPSFTARRVSEGLGFESPPLGVKYSTWSHSPFIPFLDGRGRCVVPREKIVIDHSMSRKDLLSHLNIAYVDKGFLSWGFRFFFLTSCVWSSFGCMTCSLGSFVKMQPSWMRGRADLPRWLITQTRRVNRVEINGQINWNCPPRGD